MDRGSAGTLPIAEIERTLAAIRNASRVGDTIRCTTAAEGAGATGGCCDGQGGGEATRQSPNAVAEQLPRARHDLAARSAGPVRAGRGPRAGEGTELVSPTARVRLSGTIAE
ncbi:MAG TPA: hypothetical protein VFC19_29245, partial [Candidatus Limnocylindrales bacterium]|nr:hypothetical protein [Candidatus Limnocylindrales bacterium]